jgi:tRNA A64-2'-O-ribosylphosphate transferase
MPDALSKTIPIWCAVINRAVAKHRGGQSAQWDTALYVPPNVVSGTEKSQIEARIEGWAEALLVSGQRGSMDRKLKENRDQA